MPELASLKCIGARLFARGYLISRFYVLLLLGLITYIKRQPGADRYWSFVYPSGGIPLFLYNAVSRRLLPPTFYDTSLASSRLLTRRATIYLLPEAGRSIFLYDYHQST